MTNLSLQTANSTPFNTAIITAIPSIDSTAIRMTSQEIADLVQVRHDNVKRSVERLAESGVITLPPMEETSFLNSIGRTQHSQVYAFIGEQGKRDTMVIVAQLSPQFLGTVVDRWLELERAVQQPQFALPTTFSQALLLAAQLEEQKEQLALQVAQQQQVIEIQQVDVDALERIASRKGSMSMRDAAKLLNMRQKDLRDWMLANKWTYSPYAECYRPTSVHATAGHLTLSANDYKPLVRVTWKGIALLAKRLNVTLDTDNI